MPHADEDVSPRPYSHTLTTAEARAFYGRFGAKQDMQAFYEDRALAPLIAHADFQHAQSIFEFGCGTGRLAARLFTSRLPDTCHYLGVDISTTMVALARERLRPWANRADVVCSEGVIPPQCVPGAYDRFVSTYVLDLMSEEAIEAVLANAHRLLYREGLLCLVSLTHGHGVLTKLVSAAWQKVHRLSPTLVVAVARLRYGTSSGTTAGGFSITKSSQRGDSRPRCSSPHGSARDGAPTERFVAM